MYILYTCNIGKNVAGESTTRDTATKDVSV